MNRRKFIKLLAALPFVGALWRNLADEAEAATLERVEMTLATVNPDFSVGVNNDVLVYRNGKLVWETIPRPATYEHIELVDMSVTVDAPDQMTITAVGDNGEVWQTKDNGVTWEQVS